LLVIFKKKLFGDNPLPRSNPIGEGSFLPHYRIPSQHPIPFDTCDDSVLALELFPLVQPLVRTQLIPCRLVVHSADVRIKTSNPLNSFSTD